MKDPRFWSVVLAGAWFLVGLGVGVAVSERQDNPSPLASYADSISRVFELSEPRRRVLLQLLDEYESQRDEIRRRHESNTRDAMEPELRALDAAVESRIRDTILPPSQRDLYDELGRPLAQVAAR
ncbi:MAG: hypothetical protein AAF957_01505 [Planctomycetota bacterium]